MTLWEMKLHGSLLMLGLSGPELTAAEEALVRELRPVGFMLGFHNLVSLEQTRRLTDALRELSPRQPLVAIADAGGRATPTRGIAPPGPGAAALAAHADAKTTGTAGMLTGELLRLLGVNFNFAPQLDLAHHRAGEQRQSEGAWGRDPQRVIDHAGQWNRWLRKRGIVTCGGTFPAGGRAIAEPHHELPTVAATLEELLCDDLLPYTALLPELDAIRVGQVMVPHLDADWPAALSPRVIRRLLRDQLGFDHGLVVADAFDQGPLVDRYGRAALARMALEAGNDVLRVGTDPDRVREVAAALTTVPFVVLAEAWERVERLRDKLHWPMPWSAAKVAETCAKLAALTTQVSASVNDG